MLDNAGARQALAAFPAKVHHADSPASSVTTVEPSGLSQANISRRILICSRARWDHQSRALSVARRFLIDWLSRNPRPAPAPFHCDRPFSSVASTYATLRDQSTCVTRQARAP